jgi:hypothetical protein
MIHVFWNEWRYAVGWQSAGAAVWAVAEGRAE